MNRKIFLALITVVLGIFAVGSTTQAATYGDLTYEISNGEVTITDCITSASGSLIIPNEINGYPVTTIGGAAFHNCTRLTSITIPDSVSSIGESAFSWCEGLTSITIPDSVTSIGEHAFAGCYSLTSITIPASVTSISDYAFHNCPSLTDITIPDGVTTIGDSAFCECTSLTSITIPDSVTTIGSSAFYLCDALTDVYYTGSKEDWESISIYSENSALTNANIIFVNYEPHITIIDVDMDEHPAKAWDVLISGFDYAREYHAKFFDDEETTKNTFNFNNVETSGDVSFAVLLLTLRKNVGLIIEYSK